MLKVTIISFAYKHGLPEDRSGNGGGYVFDCRGLPNPYKSDRYRYFSGNMPEIHPFFNSEPMMSDYIRKVENLLGISIENYLHRNFENLHIAFGCTGGQHRSVYCGEQIAEILAVKYRDKIDIDITHRERQSWITGPK